MKDIKKIHNINIFVNDRLVDIFSQDALNLRFNNIFPNPTKIKTITAEYSFSFVLPITKNNEKIFDYANVLSKRNKFNKRYPANVNVDGMLIFNGELLLTSVDKNGYHCNLFINKLNTLDTIFGDTKMNEIINWKIDYNQNETINQYNIGNIKYPQPCFFPLVSYGLFQKTPDENNNYTPKTQIDDSNKFYNENFYPSLNLLSTVKKCFETKGYNVDGNIFDDDDMKQIYMSTSIAQKQEPFFNYGKPEMGKCSLSFKYKNRRLIGKNNNVASATSVRAELEDKKYKLGKDKDGIDIANYEYNNIYDIFSADKEIIPSSQTPNPNAYLTIFSDKSYLNNILWRENRLVAQASGYYKIRLEATIAIDQKYKFPRSLYRRSQENLRSIERYDITPTSADVWTFKEFFTEFQLVRNSQDGTEVRNILPDAIDIVDDSTYNHYPAYPHEPNGVGVATLSTPDKPYPMGYVPQKNTILNYDPSVNKDFICGTAIGGAYAYNSVIKNGRSWKADCTDTNKSRYSAMPYYGIKVEPIEGVKPGPNRSRRYTQQVPELTTDYGKHNLQDSHITLNKINDYTYKTIIECIVYLHKNDYIQAKLVERRWDNSNEIKAEEEGQEINGRPGSRGYTDFSNDAAITIDGKIDFEAFSPEDKLNDAALSWKDKSKFDTMLNLANFLNKEEKMSDFLNNFIKEFNLSYSQNGKNITINTQKINLNNVKNAIDITDRVNVKDAVIENIEYPSKMFVEYSNDDGERGYYLSASYNATPEQMEGNNWKDYANKGYEKVVMTEDEYASEQSIKTKTSYNWFDSFTFKNDGQNTTLALPVIGKDEWYIEGYRYEEMLKYDGLSLKRRYWIPGGYTSTYVYLNNDKNRKVNIRQVRDETENLELSYYPYIRSEYARASETLLSKYFNIFYSTDSNYIVTDVYLTTEEYIAIKNGAMLVIDDDVYIPIELQGYDCSGKNKTKIKAIKK